MEKSARPQWIEDLLESPEEIQEIKDSLEAPERKQLNTELAQLLRELGLRMEVKEVPEITVPDKALWNLSGADPLGDLIKAATTMKARTGVTPTGIIFPKVPITPVSFDYNPGPAHEVVKGMKKTKKAAKKAAKAMKGMHIHVGYVDEVKDFPGL